MLLLQPSAWIWLPEKVGRPPASVQGREEDARVTASAVSLEEAEH